MRKVLSAVVVIAAAALTCTIQLDVVRNQALVGFPLRAALEGQLYEDVFGFGFWLTWTLLAAIELPLLLIAWLLVDTRTFRAGLIILLAAFFVASALDYAEGQRIESAYRQLNDLACTASCVRSWR